MTAGRSPRRASIVGLGRRPAERQPERAARLVLRVAHRRQDVADLGRAGRAGRADGCGDPLEVEREGDRVAVRAARDDREEARQALARVAGQLRAVGGEDGRLEPLAEPAHAGDGRRQLVAAPGRRRWPCRRPRRRPPCPPGDAAPGCRRAAGQGCGSRAGRTARRRPSGPRTCGRRARRRSAPSASRSRSIYGAAWTASTWKQHAAVAPDPVHDVGDRLDRPDLVVGDMTETRIVRSVIAASSASGSTRP